MVVYTLERRLEVGLRSTYRRCRFWQKKSSFQMKLILILAGMYTSKTRPKRVTVWCGFWSRGIIGPFFVENEQGEDVTVGPIRRSLSGHVERIFVYKKLKSRILGTFGFKTTALRACHTAEATLDVLEDRIISPRSDVVWPPRSCDLTPLD